MHGRQFILKDKATLLQRDDANLFGKTFCAHIITTEKSTKKAIEVLKTTDCPSSSKNLFQKAPSVSISTKKGYNERKFVYAQKKSDNRHNSTKFQTQDGRWSGQQQDQHFYGKFSENKPNCNHMFPELIPM